MRMVELCQRSNVRGWQDERARGFYTFSQGWRATRVSPVSSLSLRTYLLRRSSGRKHTEPPVLQHIFPDITSPVAFCLRRRQSHRIQANPPRLPYKTHKIEISKNTQKEDWFLAINPNGRIPALTDTFSDGQPINLFESGSIMQYLVDRYDTEHKISFPKGTREYYEMNNWLFFQNAGVGPMQGQASKYLIHTFSMSEH